MKECERLQIAIPTGVFENDILYSLKYDLGLSFNREMREFKVIVENMPIDFVLMRASSIPSVIIHPQSTVKAGITGSDILWDYGLGKDCGDEYPLNRFQPEVRQAKLYVGITGSFRDTVFKRNNREPLFPDLRGSRIATKYANITREIFSARGVPDVIYHFIPGSDEALQYVFPDCNGILSILSSGQTLQANNIRILEIVHEVTLRLMQHDGKMNNQERNILNDLRERIAVSLEKKRVL